MTLISILDQSPVRQDGPPGHSIGDTLALAEACDGLGFTRYWVAEHHAIASVGIAAPEVILGMLADRTRHLRIGSGGILLPNHRPIHVAEQFLMLAALHPGRIDLGVGRAEGALDEAMVEAFARPADNAHGAGFEEQVDQLLAFGGVRPLPADHPLAGLRASPAVPLPPVYLLGSSVNSASTAARKGLGYGFAAYQGTQIYAEALRRYREEFVPMRPGDTPHAILALKVITGEDEEHARALDSSARLAIVRNRLGDHRSLQSVEESLAHDWTEEELAVRKRFVDERADVVGDAEQVRAGIEAAVAASGADEVIVTTNTYDPAERRAAFARLAAALELPAAR